MAYNLNQLPPVSKQAEEDEDAIRSMAANLRILTEGIRKKTGVVSGYDITLSQDAMPTFIDFTRIGYNINVPAGTAVVTPLAWLYIVDLVNIGPGIIKYSLNLNVNEAGTKTLLNGQSVRHESERPLYHSITFRAIGSNATCNLGFER